MAIQLTYPDGAALVCGGTGRVGEGATRRLAEAGFPVVFTYRGSEARAAEMEETCRAQGLDVHRCRMDLGDTASIDAALSLAVGKGGRLHSIISAGGPMVPFDKIADIDPDVAEKFLREDAMGIYRLCARAIPLLRASGGGSVTICTTIANRRVVDFDGLSPFSKGAVEALVRQLAAEEAPVGIRCNAVAVSWVSDLEPQRQIDELVAVPSPIRERIIALINQLASHTRLARPALPREVGDLFAFLASDQAAYITGQSIGFDGGFTL